MLPPQPAGAQQEQRELLAALQQPLLSQAPLQSLLEHIVGRLAGAAAEGADLQRRLGALERAHADAADVRARVRALEERLQSAPAGGAPFALAALADRVGALEAAALRLEEDARRLKYATGDVRRRGGVRRTQLGAPPARTHVRARALPARAYCARPCPPHTHMQVLEPRVAAAEARLCGVANLAGRLMALDQVAGELGVAIPDAEHVASALAGAGAACGPQQAAAPPAAAELEAPSNGGGSGCVPSKVTQELFALRSALDLARAEGGATAAATAQLQTSVASLAGEVAASEERQSGRAAGIQAGLQAMADAVAAQLGAVRRECLRPPDVSLAEFARLQSAVAGAVEEAKAAAGRVASTKVGAWAVAAPGQYAGACDAANGGECTHAPPATSRRLSLKRAPRWPSCSGTWGARSACATATRPCMTPCRRCAQRSRPWLRALTRRTWSRPRPRPLPARCILQSPCGPRAARARARTGAPQRRAAAWSGRRQLAAARRAARPAAAWRAASARLLCATAAFHSRQAAREAARPCAWRAAKGVARHPGAPSLPARRWARCRRRRARR